LWEIAVHCLGVDAGKLYGVAVFEMKINKNTN